VHRGRGRGRQGPGEGSRGEVRAGGGRVSLGESDLRRGMAVLDQYREQIEAFAQQQEIVRISLEEHMRARETLTRYREAGKGAEVLVPVGANSFLVAGSKEEAEADVTSGAIGDSGKKIKEDKLEEVLYDLEIALLESDVAFPVAKEIVDRLADDLKGKRIARDVGLAKGVEAALRDAITEALSVPPLDFFALLGKAPRPFVVMFVGVNGTGKTTTIAKLAYHIQKKGLTCVVAAADTFRAGAIEQLEKHAEAIGFKLIKHKAGADPAAVAFD